VVHVAYYITGAADGSID